MTSPLPKRFDVTMQFVTDEDVSFVEALKHLYLWTLLEITLIQRRHHRKQIEKLVVRGKELTDRINVGLDVINFRKSLKSL